MIYECPMCGQKFRTEGGGLFSCPSCAGRVRVSSPAAAGNAWDTTPRGGWADAFISTTRDALKDPVAFFRSVAAGSGWRRPWAYAIVMSALVFFVSAAYQLGFQALASGADIGGVLTDPMESLAFLSIFPLSAGALVAFAVVGVPLGATAGLLIQAGLYHACLFLVGSVKSGFEGTFRVACYSMAPQVLQVLPFFGGPLAWGWQIVLAIVGLKVVHGTSYARGSLAVLLPMILCCGFLILIGLAAAGWIFAALIWKAA